MRHFGQTRRYRKLVRSFTNEALNEWQSCYPLNDLYTIMRKSLTFYRSGIKGNKWCGTCIIIYSASQLHPSIVWPRHDVRELFDILGLILISSYMNYGHTMKSTCDLLLYETYMWDLLCDRRKYYSKLLCSVEFWSGDFLSNFGRLLALDSSNQNSICFYMMLQVNYSTIL